MQEYLFNYHNNSDSTFLFQYSYAHGDEIHGAKNMFDPYNDAVYFSYIHVVRNASM